MIFCIVIAPASGIVARGESIVGPDIGPYIVIIPCITTIHGIVIASGIVIAPTSCIVARGENMKRKILK